MTTQAKHTPGPWTVEPAKGTLCAWRVDNEAHTAVAFVAQTIGDNQIEDANARLIASAPDLLIQRDALLEALQAFAALDVSTCHHCEGNGLQYPEPCKDACHTCGGTGELVSSVLPQDVKKARAAIQSATLNQ